MPSNRTPPVTLREVARAAGVSTASASRALAQQGAVSADLQRRILAAATRLGYTPNLAARQLAGGRSGLIGLLINDLTDPLIGAVLSAFEVRLAEAGYGVLLATSRGSLDEGLDGLRRLVGRGVKAVVLSETAHSVELSEAMRRRAVPSVAVGEHTGSGPPAVGLGRRRGAALAARYLLELGHRRIGVLGPDAAGTVAGVTDALTGNNAATYQAAAEPARQDHDAVQAGIRLLLESDDPPTAVVCGNDLLALAVVRECLQRGIAVPSGLSIVGFGDAEFARRTSPALTTVRIAAADVGLRLAENLLSALQRGMTPEAFEPPVKLVVRESTAMAPR
jgi:LacI family transcriptional regulator